MYQALFRCCLIHLGRGYPHFQMWKVKFRQGKWPLQGHAAYNFKKQALIPNLLLYKSKDYAAYSILSGKINMDLLSCHTRARMDQVHAPWGALRVQKRGKWVRSNKILIL